MPANTKTKIASRIAYLLTGCLLAACLIFFFVLPPIVDKSLNKVTPHEPYELTEASETLHRTLFIGDLHADPTLWGRDLRKPHQYGHIDLPRMRQGNQALQVFTVVTKSPRGLNYAQNKADTIDNVTLLAVSQRWPFEAWGNLTKRALYQASLLHKIAARAPEEFVLIKDKNDLETFVENRAKGSQIIGGIIGTEGSHALEGDIKNIDVLYEAGFRMMSLQHFFDNLLGGSLHGSSKSGLTEFGKEVVQRIDALPILLDLSHSSEQVVKDTLPLINNPVVISHTGTQGHCQTLRNISDELMIQIAEQGGIIGIGYWDAAVCDFTPAGVAQAIKAAIELVGEDHVALGSDFDGAVETAMDVSELPALTHALLEQGLSEDTIRKVMGENMLRLFKQRLQ